MAKILINGTEYEIPSGAPINAIQMAMHAGIEIPYYCWHPALSVVANCRMCEIEVGSIDPKTGETKMLPRLVPGCQTPAKDGTVLVTNSEKVKAHQRMIMEYLLINHPLDCPVCDQAGQCGLQDYSFEYGQSVHRFVEERTVNPRKEVSEKIQLNQDRCIMCTRCVRFTREITHTDELQVMRRGSHAEITIFPGKPVDNPLAGNVVDLCPVGALLDKDFLHKQRYWFLSRHDGICTRCATGCNILIEENRGQVWRFRARHNPHVNDYWICDEGRSSYKAANDPALLSGSYVRTAEGLGASGLEVALRAAGRGLQGMLEQGGKLALVLSPFLTVEEAYLASSYVKGLDAASVVALGPVPRLGEDQTFAPDKRTGRTGDTTFVVPRPFVIRAEKCPNQAGVERIARHFEGEVIGYESLLERVERGEVGGLIVTGGGLEPAYTEQDANRMRRHVEFLLVIDAWPTPVAQAGDVVIAGATYAERAGSYVNAEGRLQYGGAALPPREGSLPDLDIWTILLGRGSGPADSRVVLEEIAEKVAGFEQVRGGKAAPYGVVLDTAGEAQAPSGDGVVFSDPWFAARSAAGSRNE
jgi:NADH-quinone oxidoreductase subunit G